MVKFAGCGDSYYLLCCRLSAWLVRDLLRSCAPSGIPHPVRQPARLAGRVSDSRWITLRQSARVALIAAKTCSGYRFRSTAGKLAATFGFVRCTKGS
jgi:hypothetical protein